MKGDKLTSLIEKEINRFAKDPSGTPEAMLTWQEYMEDIAELAKPTEEEIQAIVNEIQESSTLSRVAETGWKIVPFLSTRAIGEDAREKAILTYIILNNEGNIVHAEGSGKVAEILPKELLENAVEVEIPTMDGTEIRLDNVVLKPGRTLEESLKSCF